jgi:hypothetical protein
LVAAISTAAHLDLEDVVRLQNFVGLDQVLAMLAVFALKAEEAAVVYV